MPPTDQPPPWSAPQQGSPPPPPPPATPGYPPAPGYGGPQGQPPPPGAHPGGSWAPQAKPPRPATPIAGLLLIVGGAVVVVGTFLPWLSGGGESLNGWDFSDGSSDGSDAGGYVFLAAVLIGFGITTLAARRLLPIAILATVFAAFTAIAAIVDLADLSDLSDFFGTSVGPGMWVILASSLVALAGAIWTLSVRRTWR